MNDTPENTDTLTTTRECDPKEYDREIEYDVKEYDQEDAKPQQKRSRRTR